MMMRVGAASSLLLLLLLVVVVIPIGVCFGADNMYVAGVPPGGTRHVLFQLEDVDGAQFSEMGVSGTAVRDIKFHDGTLFVGGRGMVSTSDIPSDTTQLFSFTGSFWSRPASVGGGQVNAITQIPATQGIVESPPTLFLGGTFSFVADVEAPRVAMESDAAGVWESLGWGVRRMQGNTNAASVSALVRGSGFRIYVGGDFTQANFTDALNVAYWDADPAEGAIQKWVPMGAGSPSPVTAMAFEGARLYTVGAFGLRYYSELTDSWAELATPSSASGVFQCVGVSQDGVLVFVGGTFSSLTPQGSATPINATNLAVYNTNTKTWTALNTNGPVVSIDSSPLFVFVGGDFTSLGGQSISSLARYTISSGQWSQVSSNPSVLGRVVAMAYGVSRESQVASTPGVFNAASTVSPVLGTAASVVLLLLLSLLML